MRILCVMGKIALWFLGVLVGLMLLVWLAILVFFPDDKIRRMLIKEIEQRTGLRVRVGSLDLQVLSGLVLEEVALDPPEGFTDRPFEVERVVVDYSLAGILDEKLTVRRIRIEQPFVRLQWEGERSNLKALLEEVQKREAKPEPEPGEDDQGFVLNLESVEILDASVAMDGPGGMELKISGLGVRVSGRLASPEETRLQAEILLPVPESVNVRVKNAGISVAAGLKLSASLEGPDRVTVRGELGLDRLVVWPGGAPQSFAVTFEGQGDLARGELEISSLELRQADESLVRASGRLSGEGHGRRVHLDVEHLALTAPGVTGLLGLDRSSLVLSGTARLSSARVDWEMAAGGLPSLAGDLVFEDLGVRLGGIRLSRGKGTLHLKVGPGDGGNTVLGVAGPVRAGVFTAGNLRIVRPEVRLAVKAELRPEPESWSVELTGLEIQGRLDRVTASSLAVDGLSFNSRLTGGDLRPDGAGWLSGRLRGSARSVTVSGLAVEQPRLTVELSGRGILTGRPGRLPVGLDLSVQGIELGRGHGKQPWRVPGRTRIQLAGTLEPRPMKLSLDRFEAGFGPVLELRASGTVDVRRPAMDVTFSTSKHSLERLIAGLPQDIKEVLPPVTGQVQLSGRFDGRLAVPRDWRRMPFEVDLTVANQDVAFELPSAGVAVRGVSGQVRLTAGEPKDRRVRSRVNLTIERASLGAAGIEARGVAVGLASALFGEEFESDGRVTAARIDARGLWPRPLFGVQLDFASLLTGFKDLRLTDLRLALDSAGLTLSGHGQVVRTPGADHWSDLRISMQTRTRFASGEPVDLPGGLTARGLAELELGLISALPGVLGAEGHLAFSGLDIEGPGLVIEGIRGGIPVSQLIRVRPRPGLLARSDGRDGEDRQAKEVVSARSSAYEQALRPLKGESRTFSIHKLRFKDLVFSDLSGNLELAAGVLSLGSLRFGFLRGDVVADTVVAFAPADKRRLDLDAEMSGIDLSGLGALTLAGSSDVSGNLRLGLDLNQQDLSVAFNLTQIGRSTLQACLVALDPRESNPGLVSFRKYLHRYKVSPREVSLDVRHGLLSMRIKLDMGPLAKAAAGFVQGFSGDTFAITHIPVGGFLAKYLEF